MLLCDKPEMLNSSFRSVQSAFGAQRSDPRFCEIWVEVELEGGSLCNALQVRKKKNKKSGLHKFTFCYATVPKSSTGCASLLSNRFTGFSYKEISYDTALRNGHEYSEFTTELALNVCV